MTEYQKLTSYFGERQRSGGAFVIDSPERIAGAYGIIDELTSERGLVTCETISCLDEAGLRAQARR